MSQSDMTMDETISDGSVYAPLDWGHIERAAAYSADRLRQGLPARVVLTPGDFTRYDIAIVPSCPSWIESRYEPDGEFTNDEAVVSIVNFGICHAWAFSWMHDAYCAEKWGLNGNHATGRVMAGYLNAIRDALGMSDRESTC